MSKKNLFIIIASITTILVAIITTFILINNKNDTPITYKVTFNSNGGTAIKEQIVNEGEKATKPNDPTKEGYLFVEWQYNNLTFNFATKIEKDITLIAKWQEVEEEKEMVTVRFETDGGTTISNQIIESGTKITKPEVPTKEGYVFKGWYHNEEEFNFDNPITEDIEIKAKWEKEQKEEKPKEEKEPKKEENQTYKAPTLKMTAGADGVPGPVGIKDGKYIYDLAIDFENYMKQEKYTVDGYDVFEKVGTEYKKIASGSMGGAAVVEVEAGTKKILVAKVYVKNSSGTKVYSAASNELELNP